MLNLTKCPIKKGILAFSIPIIFSMLTQQLYQVADTIIVGNYLGVNELAAVGNAGSIIGLFVVISGGIEMGCEVIFARYMGKRQFGTIVRGIIDILLFSLVLALLLSGAAVLLQSLMFDLINIPEGIRDLTSEYMTIYSLGITFIFLYDISRAILISMGDAKIPFMIVLFSSLLNISLDLLFIVTFNMGVAGAALGTVIAQFTGMVIVLCIVVKRVKNMPCSKEKFAFLMAQLLEVLSVSVPTMVQQTVFMGTVLILQSLINPFGSEVISGYIAVNKIIILLIMVVIGMCQTLSVYTAQNLGAGEKKRVQAGYQFCRRFVMVYVLAVVLINFIFADWMLSMFVDAKESSQAVAFGAHYLICSSVMLFFNGLRYINESFLRGYAKMRAFLLSNFSDLIVKLLFTYLFLSVFGTDSFWMAATLGTFTAFILSSLIIRRSSEMGFCQEVKTQFEKAPTIS